MAVKQSKIWSNVPFRTWEYKEQTEIKHSVLKYYFPQWLQILSSWNLNLNYIDGFGGIGAYHTQEDIKERKYVSKSYGSPIFSIEAIDKFKGGGGKTKANVLIIDKETENLENIKKILKYEKLGQNINVDFLSGDFDKNINNLLDKVKNLAPTFFMIDPFGYSQIKLKTIKRIMEHKNSEVMLNFMYNAIQRWVSCPSLEEHFNDLFGCKHWKQYANCRTNKKEQLLVDLFRFHCKEFSEFVYPFRLRFPDKNMPFYYLFHLCNHRKGCILMKDSFAKFNLGSLEYKGKSRRQLELNLFVDEEKKDWEEYLFANFAGVTIPYKKLLDLIIDLVPSRERDIKKVLQCLEQEKKIKIDGGERKRKCGIIEQDLVIFKSK